MKKISLILIALCLVTAFAFADYYPAGNIPQPSISEETAIQTALKHAGLKAEQCVFINSHIEFDDGFLKYDIKFFDGTIEYDYDIDAQDGRILSMDRERKYYAYNYQQPVNQVQNVQPAPQPAPQATQQQNVQLTKQQALDIALKHAGVSQSDVRMTKVKQDYEHGKLVYEIEFRIGRTEYEYEIDAYTGDIRKYDMDND